MIYSHHNDNARMVDVLVIHAEQEKKVTYCQTPVASCTEHNHELIFPQNAIPLYNEYFAQHHLVVEVCYKEYDHQ